ncbi:MAG: hypothetical protein MUP74_02340 [Desulfobacterales bacterium]|nr:hypothetical protein [Desulfobacterales bacterium]
MASRHPFGNDPAKIEKYKAFWNRDPVKRPLVGFTKIGWFPLQYFSACRSWEINGHITPDMLDPEAFLDDYERLLQEGEEFDDDILRGVCPIQVAVPCFLPAALGCRVQVLPDNVMAVEQKLSWDAALAVRLDPANPWFQKYLQLAEAMVQRAAGRYPVCHGAELGPTDLHAVLRGHNESLIDLMDAPDKCATLLETLGHIFREFTEVIWTRLPLFHGGYFDAQYQLWAPGPIARLQEDATAVFSPALYRRLVQPVDRMLACHFANSFIHLHSTAMFMLDAFLEIEELRCLEINIESFNIPVEGMIPYFHRVQAADRSLLIRGSTSPDELRMLLDALDPRGLYLQIVVEQEAEIDALRSIVGM